MFYDKKYVISDYLNHEELNELIDKEKELINEMAFKKVKDDEYVYVNGEQKEAGSDYDLLGNTTQNGTPTPTSPIAVETVSGRQVVSVSNGTNTQNYEINLGKNIADIYLGGMQKGHTETINGITFTINDDGTISGSGTATAQSNFRFFGTWTSIAQNIPIDKNSYYHFSSNGTKDSQSRDNGYFYVRVAKIKSDGTLYYSTVNNNSSFTGYDYINLIMLTVGQGVTVDFNGKWCQIEKGSQATPFVEYKTPIELCKIENYKDFIRKGTGKNLLQLTDGTYSNNGITAVVNNGIIVLNGTASANSFISIPSNIDSIYSSLSGSYTLCSNNERTVGSTTTSGTYADVRIMGNNGVSFIWINILGNQNASQTSTPSTYTNISLQIRTGSGLSYSNFVIEPQLEKGNQVTEYEPYGYKDKWYLYKTIGKVVLNGRESWAEHGNTTNNIHTYYRYVSGMFKSRTQLAYSDYFYYLAGCWSVSNKAEGQFSGETNGAFYFNSSINNLADFKTWLGIHNTSVYYVLVTPTTTEITDTELINQLESVWKSIKYWNYIEILPIENYDLDLPIYNENDFVFLEDISKIEKNIMQLSYDFFQPPRYIQNKIWNENPIDSGYNNFGAEDLNRMITDMNILYEHKDDTPTIYNLYANENWNEESSLEWE